MKLNKIILFLISILICIGGVATLFSTEFEILTKAIICGMCLLFGCLNFYTLSED